MRYRTPQKAVSHFLWGKRVLRFEVGTLGLNEIPDLVVNGIMHPAHNALEQ